MKKRVLFVVPPQEFGYGYINDFFWQQGLLHLATYLEKVMPNSVSIQICDGNIRTLEECKSLILNSEFDVIGLHCVDHSKRYTFELVELACKKGCKKILFGGAGAILSPEQYLLPMRKYPDNIFFGCCTGAGERFMEGVLKDKALDEVPNLTYLKNGEIVSFGINEGKPEDELYLETLSFEKYEDILRYVAEQLKRRDYPYIPITYSTLSHDGCIHRLREGCKLLKGCSFCAIPAERYTPRNPELLWKEVTDFNRLCEDHFGHRVRSIKDWGDNLNFGLLRQLLKARPKECEDIGFSCYFGISDINEEVLDLLKEMNCFSIYVGVDGTSDESLNRLNKQYTVDQLWERLSLIKKYSFQLEIGSILGVYGETKESLNDTVQFMQKMKNLFEKRIIVLQGNILVPMPGSTVFNQLRKKHLDECTSASEDPLFLGVNDRIKLWLRYFTDVTFEDCIEAQRRIETISPRKHSYACRRGTV